MAVFGEAFGRSARYSLRGRIAGDEFWIRLFKLAQTAQQLIVLVVADLRVAANVIPLVVVAEEFSQMGNLFMRTVCLCSHSTRQRERLEKKNSLKCASLDLISD